MARAKMVVPAAELNAKKLMALLEEAEIPAEPGPEGMNNVQVDMNGLVLLIDAYPQQRSIKIWTAQGLDHESVELPTAVRSANSFNEVFLFVRNFVYQDPTNPANYRAVWDHDRVIAGEGLTSEELVTTLSTVAGVLIQALSHDDTAGHA